MHVFQYDDLPVIATTGGKLRGYAVDDICIFKGIPYAHAERFRMPEPVAWEGVRECTSYGTVCELLNVGVPNNELAAPHRYWAMSEHCQNLNVWTPSLDRKAKKPVLVWFHGGGYSGGSAIEQEAYDGYNMAKDGDVVVVSVNHRLNIFGYLDISCLGEGYENSGNSGHADMVASLQWVHDNIEAFGGDPENVTIFGQSGGGMKVGDLIQIPAADGLFQKGIMMSGVGEGSGVIKENEKPGDGTELVDLMAEEIGCDRKGLTTVSADVLIGAYKKVKGQVKGYSAESPMPNDYYKGWPLSHGFRDHVKDITFLVGSVFGEFGMLEPFDREKEMCEEEKEEIVKRCYGKNADAIIKEFRKVYPEKDLTDAVYVDRFFRIPSIQIAKAAAAAGGKAYLYKFDLSFPWKHMTPAWHCSDIAFVFHNVEKTEVCGFPAAYRAQETVFNAAMNLAKTGDPNGKGVPEWPMVTETYAPTMSYNETSECRGEYDSRLLELADEVLPRFVIKAFANNKTQH